MGMWEGLKVFRNKDMDVSYFQDEKKKGCVRDCKSYGKLKGFRFGDDLIDFDEAVDRIFKEGYRKMVMERFSNVINDLGKKSREGAVILLDYSDEERRAPFSHAVLLKELISSANN